MTHATFPRITPVDLSILLEISPDALVVINQAGTIIHSNEQTCQMFGYTHSELRGEPLEILQPERFHAIHIAHREHYLRSPHPRYMGARLELFGKRKDGSEFPVNVSLRPVFLRKKVHILSAIRDMTEQYHIQQVRSQNAFLGIVTHELLTPLAILKGATSTLHVQTAHGHGPSFADWQYETLQDIEVAAERLIALSKNLLDVTKLQLDQLILQPMRTNVVELVKNVTTNLQQTTKQHLLQVDVTKPLIEADIDPGRFEQILINLIDNAIKYSPEGGLIVIALEEEANTLNIRIQDRGIGIPEHQQSLIFGHFIRADNAKEASISGTGLGLYLCQELVRRHEGQLWFQSTEGEGSTFFLTLPLRTSSQNSH